MSLSSWEADSAEALLEQFFSQDDLGQLAEKAGELLACPLLVLDDTFHVKGYHLPQDFSDATFQNSIACGEITYEASALISRSPAILNGGADYIQAPDSPYLRRFAPLTSAGVHLGSLICVDTDGHLGKISPQTWELVERILSKQMFVEVSRQGKPFETTEDLLRHLLDGGFSAAALFRLQASNTYLANFHPFAFALINLGTYRNAYVGQQHLKEELESQIPGSHPFLYKGDIFLFLHREGDTRVFSALAEEFRLKVIVSERLGDLFDLPELYRVAYMGLELITDERFHGGQVCTVSQLRTSLLLKSLEKCSHLIPKGLRRLADHDREKNTQYCETLYHYLICCRSLKKTCDALFTHRNTVLYRIRRLQEDFAIPLENPDMHIGLLMGVSLLLFESKGPDFFLCTGSQTTGPAQPCAE